MKRAGACLVLVFSTLGFSGAALAQGSDVEGDVVADVRVRAEHVDRQGLDETLAVTWRARLGYEIMQMGVDYFPRTRGISTLSSPSVIVKIVKEMWTLRKDLDGIQPVVR